MKLKNILARFGGKEKEKPETFLAVEISSETIKSALWTVIDGETRVLKIGSLQEWDGKNKELLITAVDASISNACEKADADPTGVIFGLPEDWINNDQIADAKKGLLKLICEKLELKPLGFVVTLEALVTYLKNEEGTPINAILVNLQETQTLISLIQLGKIEGLKTVGKSDDLAADVKEGLARFTKIENFPARMIIFDGAVDFEEYKQQLVSFDWLEALPFLHFPKVETLRANKSIEAVALAGGEEVAKSLGFEIKSKKKETTPPEAEKPTEEITEEKTDKKGIETKKEQKIDDVDKVEKTDKDKKEENTGLENLEKTTEVLSATSLGFVSGADITQASPQVNTEPIISEKEKKTEIHITAEPKEEKSVEIEESTEAKLGFQKTKPSPFSFISNLTGLIKKSILNIKLLFLGGKKRFVLILVIAGFILLSGGVFAFYSYVPKAKVIIYLEPKTLEKELTLTVDTGTGQVDEEEKIIPGEQKTITVEGEKSTTTTGEKIIGDEATGEAVIYNKTDVSKDFAAGTILIGPNNLTFTLDEEVNIASKSSEEAEEGEQIVYGKATVKITAVSIGTESNLDGGNTFSFKEYSTNLYSAKTESGLSGGTSRQIKVVAQEDVSSLLEELTEELKEKANLKLATEASSDKEILKEGMESNVLEKDFSAEAEDETDQLTLKLKTEFSAFAYLKKDLETLLASSIKDAIPEDFVFDPSQTKIETKKAEVEDNTITLTAAIKTYLLPKINFEEIKKSLSGRRLETTEEYLQQLANFSYADIEITPKLLGGLKTLPRLSKNIIIETKIED